MMCLYCTVLNCSPVRHEGLPSHYQVSLALSVYCHVYFDPRLVLVLASMLRTRTPTDHSHRFKFYASRLNRTSVK